MIQEIFFFFLCECLYTALFPCNSMLASQKSIIYTCNMNFICCADSNTVINSEYRVDNGIKSVFCAHLLIGHLSEKNNNVDAYILMKKQLTSRGVLCTLLVSST